MTRIKRRFRDRIALIRLVFEKIRRGTTPAAVRSVARHSSPGPAQAEVIAAVETFYAAMTVRDGLTLNRMLLPEALFIRTDSRVTPPVVGTRTAVGFIYTVLASEDTYVQRIWNAEVRIEGDMALLWAPYEFHTNNRFSHCGHDAIQLVRRDGKWAIAALSYTMTDKREALDSSGVRLQID